MDLLDREPNQVELGMFGALWSEHCGYKNNRPLLKMFPSEGEYVLTKVGEENAGVVDIGDGADGLGSATRLTDSAGAITDSYSYDVFGAPRTTTGTTANNFQYTGQQRDGNANRGLYFLRARSYDPALGRFLQRDGVPLINRYSYSGNNPANLTDPTGNFPCPRCKQLKKAIERTSCVAFNVELICAAADVGYEKVSTAVQIADIAPVTILPTVGLWLDIPSTELDILAGIFGQIDILRSNCSVKKKFGLSGTNAANLGVGLGGGFLSGLLSETDVGQIPIGLETASVEGTLYTANTLAIKKCDKER
ncbi:MAG: hypothetical protein M3P30_07095 [Chloroflexota bacterium]|nr:hypothetical protein [Chloroflexota bacterium]